MIFSYYWFTIPYFVWNVGIRCYASAIIFPNSFTRFVTSLLISLYNFWVSCLCLVQIIWARQTKYINLRTASVSFDHPPQYELFLLIFPIKIDIKSYKLLKVLFLHALYSNRVSIASLGTQNKYFCQNFLFVLQKRYFSHIHVFNFLRGSIWH